MKKSNFIFAIFLNFLPSFAFATTVSEARQSALDFGSAYKNSAATVVTEQNKQNSPGYTTDNPEETKYYSGADMSADAQNKVANSQEGKLMTEKLPNRPQIKVTSADSFLSSAKQIQNNPDEVIAMFSGNYNQCTPVEITAKDVETKTCDFYAERQSSSCLVDQIVEVKNHYDYSCNQIRKARDKTCDKTLNLICEESSYAFPPTTYNSLPNFSYSNFSLKYTTPSRMGQNCGGHNYYWRFTLHSVDQVEEFKFLWGQADDRTMIYINGNLVHNYPNRGCELSRTSYSAPNIDLKPYLKSGDNELNVRIIVGGLGEGTGEFKLKYKECSKVAENWQEVCP